MSDLIRSHTEAQPDSRASRRSFLKIAGIGGAVLVAAGCDSNTPDPITPGDFTSLMGTVTVAADADPGQTPVAGVTVNATSTDAGIQGTRTTMTDANGMYTFENLPVGTYTVSVATSNFVTEDVTENVTVGVGSPSTVNFSLTPGGDITLDFSNDFGVLNYAYALEQLEAAFYAAVVADPMFTSTFNADEQAILTDIAAHEGIHRDFLQAAIVGAGGTFAARTLLPGLTPDFDGKPTATPPVPAVDFASRTSVLATALTFEDLGVGAYNGAAKFISTTGNGPTYLLIAGKIVSVEARHASVIAGLITDNAVAGEEVINADGLDRALAPSAVLTAAAAYLENGVSAINA